MLVWANMHGSWTMGVVVLAIWLGDEGWRAYSLRSHPRSMIQALRLPVTTVAVSIGMLFINPRGIGIISHAVAILEDPTAQTFTTEWMPPTFRDLNGGIFLVGLLLSALLQAVSPRRPNMFESLAFLAFSILGLQMIRGSVWFDLAMAPILATHLAAAFPQPPPGP